MTTNVKLKPCGTWAAYQRHIRNGEEPCDACERAMRRRSAEQYWERKWRNS